MEIIDASSERHITLGMAILRFLLGNEQDR